LREIWGQAALSLAALVALLLPLLLSTGPPSADADVVLVNGRWVVDWVDAGGVAARAGLKPGDVLVAVNGAAPVSRHLADPMLDLRAAGAWTIERQGRLVTLYPDPEEVRESRYLDTVFTLATALTFWAVATFVGLCRPNDQLAARFFRCGLAAAVLLGPIAVVSNDTLWGELIAASLFGVAPALFVDFALWFAGGAAWSKSNRIVVTALYCAGIASAAGYFISGVLGSDLFFTMRLGVRLLTALGCLLGVAILIHGYLRPVSVRTRQQLKVVAFGAATAMVPFLGLVVVPTTLGLEATLRPQAAFLGVSILPLSFAYAILRERLLDIDVVIERTLVYGLLTLLLAALYALFLYGLQFAGAVTSAGRDPVLSVIFFALVTLTFIPARDQIQRLIDRLIYRDRYDYASTLQSLGAQLASVQPIDQVLKEVACSLAGAMNLRGAAVLLREPEGNLVVTGAAGECARPEVAERLVERAHHWREEAKLPASLGYWIPLQAHGEESGLLYLGPKRAPADLSYEDLSLAETVASHASVAIANALLVERLRMKVTELELLRDRLLRVQEEERKRLARDLHDGPLHTVLDLVRQAEGICSELAPLYHANHSLLERVHNLAERGRDAAHEVRTVCTDLYPSELAHLGLVAALGSLARTTSRDENIVVHFVPRSFPAELRLPESVEDTLYRVAREALNNACRHAEAATATIELRLEGRQVVLVVRDDGRGFTVPASTASLLRRGHLGLASMRELVQRLGGDLTITSAPGQGTEVRVRLSIDVEDAQWTR